MRPIADDFGASPLREWIIDRPRLRHLLDEAPGSAIVLCAPAGYGKSTLTRQWLASHDFQAAWCQCTRASSDVARLATGLADAISRTTGMSFTPLVERLKVTDKPQAEGVMLAEILLANLLDRPRNLVLVLDDYHMVAQDVAAEDFIGRLVLGTGLRSVVSTRVRPRWATARHVLYGDLTEVETADLAMTDQEASAVFTALGRAAPPDLVAQADGWPAVIGLLALGPAEGAAISGPVEQFVAEEVVRTFDSDVADALSVLASFQRVDSSLASALLGEDLARRCADACDEACLLTEFDPGSYEIHPLVRDYLRTNTIVHPVEDLAVRASEYCTEHRLWDELFELADRLKSVMLLDTLFEFGVRPCLDEGRSESVRRWIDYARVHRYPVKRLSLAEAELALRDGLYLQAETLALEASDSFEDLPSERAWALSIAGRAAHLGGRESEAVAHYRLGQSVATTPAERREAEWGELKCSIDLESPEAPKLLDRLRSSALRAPEDQVELASRSLILGARLGSLVAIEDARAVAQLLPLVTDPVVRCSYWNTYAYACALAGEYDEAVAALNELETDALEHRLHFVMAYLGFARAVISIGQRRFDEGFAHLTDASRVARRTGDVHVLASCAAIRARGLIALGRFDEAVAVSSYDQKSLIRAMRGELRATKALAAACNRRHKPARALSRAAQELSGTVEVPILAASVDAIALCDAEDASADAACTAAARLARRVGYVDGLIAAYRGFPELARRIASGDERLWFAGLLKRACDDEIAQVAGLGARLGANHLTRREAEVFSLLRLGMSNKEIAAKLFITEGTAKVHVRNILEKLNVRSRTEAVLVAPPIR